MFSLFSTIFNIFSLSYSVDETQKAAALKQIGISAGLMDCQNGFDVVIICTNTDKMAEVRLIII